MVRPQLEKEELLTRGARPLVVIVDDEAATLAALRRTLKDEPYDLATTETPQKALEWVEGLNVSLIISDERMPGMSGTQLLEEVLRRSPFTACMILTAYPTPAVTVRSFALGIHAIHYKPWEEESLKRVIRDLLVRPDPETE